MLTCRYFPRGPETLETVQELRQNGRLAPKHMYVCVAEIAKHVMQELTFKGNTRTNVQKYVKNIVTKLNKVQNSVKPSVETEIM